MQILLRSELWRLWNILEIIQWWRWSVSLLLSPFFWTSQTDTLKNAFRISHSYIRSINASNHSNFYLNDCFHNCFVSSESSFFSARRFPTMVIKLVSSSIKFALKKENYDHNSETIMFLFRTSTISFYDVCDNYHQIT